MNAAAVVFDCDGVLVDSEPHAAAAWIEVLADRGLTVSESDMAAHVGRSREDTLAAFVELGLVDAAGITDDLENALEARYRRGLRPFDDAADTAAALALVGTRLGVATAAPRRRLDVALEVTGVGRYFEARAAGDEVPASKPAPDVYLLAAERLGVDPGQCLAIEDTAVGTTAARAAGMRVVAVDRDGTNASALLGAGASVVPRLDPDSILLWLR